MSLIKGGFGKYDRDMIIDYLEKFEHASREKINELLIDEIRGNYSREQKLTKIGNILSYMRSKGLIVNLSTDHSPVWVLFNTYEKLREIQEKDNTPNV